ncbi:unnamed protein product [Cunninghamella echinulata]
MTKIQMPSTEEYNNFIQQLSQFHEKKGTVLQPEQVLGGKRLNLLVIYNSVIEAGGYEKVTNNCGWKQIGEPFRFPPTCTNSAYVLKAVYTKYLLGWEQEMHWKRHWTPPPEEVKGKGVNSEENIVKPKDSARQTATALIQPSQDGHFRSINNQFRSQNSYGPQFGSPAHVDSEFRTRILLALQSKLPNEVDWVFNTLVRFSYNSENFHLESTPTLIDHLLVFTDSFFSNVIQLDETIDDGKTLISIFSTKSEQEQFERVLQVFHIVRNFSFLDINIRFLAHHQQLQQRLLKSISLPPSSSYAELTRHCLDILENIAPQVILHKPDGPYLTTMSNLLFSNDRTLILGAIRSLTRLAVTEVNERILSVPNLDLIQRLFQFLLVDDEELTAATLEYFYQYTGLRGGEFAIKMMKEYPGNLVGILTGFLSYKSTVVPATQHVNDTIHGIPIAQLIASENNKSQTSNLPPDLTDFMHLDEPYRCLGWLKELLRSSDEGDTIPLNDIYNKYHYIFGSEKPLELKELYTVLKIAFRQPPEVEKAAAGPAPLNELRLKNIIYAPEKELKELACYWKDCHFRHQSMDGLFNHVLSKHVVEGQETYDCHWRHCSRKQVSSRAAMAGHLRTHIEPSPMSTAKTTKKRKTNAKFTVCKLLVDDAEVSGVPLTAALLLRNLAWNKRLHSYFMPYEIELSSLAMQRPKLSKYILTVLSEL